MNDNLEKMRPLVQEYQKAFAKEFHLGTLDVRDDLSEAELRKRIRDAIDKNEPIKNDDTSFYYEYQDDEFA